LETQSPVLHAIEWLYTLSGFCVGALVGMTGVGGGSLMTPILILLFGIHPTTAVGTDLLYAAATKTSGSFVHNYSHTIDWRVVGRLAIGSVPLTALTLLILSRFDFAGSGFERVITFILGVALLATAAALVFRRQIVAYYAARIGELSPRRTAWLTVATGAVLGVLVSITSVGAGALGVTALILLYPRLPTARIVGSDIVHAVPLTFLAGIGHGMIGSINTMILGSLLVGSIPGIIVGSFIAVRVPERVLRLMLAAVLAVVGGRLVF
jgi:uncharacterized membrane protein YfcA